MKRMIDGVRALFGIGARRARPEPMDPTAFAELFCERLRVAAPGVDLRMVGYLHASAIGVSGEPQQVFLHNAYALFVAADDDERPGVVDRYVRSCVESLTGVDRDAGRVVPVVKDAGWVDAMRRLTAEAGNPQEHFHEPLCDGLLVVYAQDTPSNIRYLNRDDVDALGVDRTALRAFAVGNLRALLPGIEIHRGPQVSMVTAGGDYEASLLLFDDLWERERARLRGEPVAAVPARDMLLFADSADSADADAVTALRAMAAKIAGEAHYALTHRLFLRTRDGVEAFDR